MVARLLLGLALLNLLFLFAELALNVLGVGVPLSEERRHDARPKRSPSDLHRHDGRLLRLGGLARAQKSSDPHARRKERP